MTPEKRAICPKCGLPWLGAPNDHGPWEPNCNPLRSPDCWTVVATLPKTGSIESRVIQAAERNEG